MYKAYDKGRALDVQTPKSMQVINSVSGEVLQIIATQHIVGNFLLVSSTIRKSIISFSSASSESHPNSSYSNFVSCVWMMNC